MSCCTVKNFIVLFFVVNNINSSVPRFDDATVMQSDQQDHSPAFPNFYSMVSDLGLADLVPGLESLPAGNSSGSPTLVELYRPESLLRLLH